MQEASTGALNGTLFGTYSGPYPIDHLDDAINHDDRAAVQHFFSLLLPLGNTHETVARILCQRDAQELLAELMAAGYWPSADSLRELLGISAWAGSCRAMSELLELAADRGIACDALVAGWLNALSSKDDTGNLIQSINRLYPGSMDMQAVQQALKAAHPHTLDTVLECLVERPDDLSERIGPLVHDCIDTLTAETASVLLAYGLDPGVKNRHGRTLIERIFHRPATGMGLKAVLQRWVAALPDGEAMTMYVLMGDDAAFLARYRMRTNESLRGFDAQAALKASISRDHVALVRVLLTMGVELNAVAGSGPPALFAATSAGAVACVELFLKAGADPDAHAAADGSCCLSLAASQGLQQIVCLLLESGADVTRLDGQGNTALHYSAMRGDIDLCARLLRAGANMEVRNFSHGSTPLSHACRFGEGRESHDVIGFLVDMGADIEARDTEGSSPVMLATLSAQTVLRNTLLEYGAEARAMSWKRMGGFRGIAQKLMLRVEQDKAPIDEVSDYDQAA